MKEEEIQEGLADVFESGTIRKTFDRAVSSSDGLGFTNRAGHYYTHLNPEGQWVCRCGAIFDRTPKGWANFLAHLPVETPEQAVSYPECEKLSAIHDERRAITEFIEWAGNRLANTSATEVDELVMEFYDIDPDKLETERRAMLEEARKQ